MRDEDSVVLAEAKQLSSEFEKFEGRRPRILLSGTGLEEKSDRRKIMATIFADSGWDVDMGALGQTADGTAQDAVDNDVHMVGFFSLADGCHTLFPALAEGLETRGRDDILVIVLGDLSEEDRQYCYDHGAAAVFGLSTPIPDGSLALLRVMVERAREEAREG